MKKEYIVPSMEVVNVEPIVMLSSSDIDQLGIINDEEVDTSTQQLGRSRRDSWGSIW